MSDYLVRMAQNPALRNMIKGVGLPAPQNLARATGAYVEKPLAGKQVLLGAIKASPVFKKIEATLGDAGATAVRVDQPVPDDDARYEALVFDASSMRHPRELKALYEFFHPVARKLGCCGRVVVFAACPETAADTATSVAARAVEGFVRSLAKEIGRRGSTANLVYVEKGTAPRIAAPLRFLLSDHSTYVDGQPWRVSKTAKMPKSQPATQALAGRVALVTGGARGIGAATAKRLAAEGAQVVCLDLPADQAELDATVKQFDGTAFAQNITDADAPRKIADFMNEKFGGVDIVIHNAGVTRDKTLANMSEKFWDMVLSINLLAILAIDEVLWGEEVLNDYGNVVCLSSIGGIAGNAGQTNYGASKAGLIGYVQRAAQVQAERGVTINAVAPGFIETRMTEEMPFMLREAGRRLNSLSQGGQPEDVAELITFLATPGASGVTGNVIRVCGQSLIGA